MHRPTHTQTRVSLMHRTTHTQTRVCLLHRPTHTQTRVCLLHRPTHTQTRVSLMHRPTHTQTRVSLLHRPVVLEGPTVSLCPVPFFCLSLSMFLPYTTLQWRRQDGVRARATKLHETFCRT